MLRVLVVCTGNICRSPMAEGFLALRNQHELDGVLRIRSAGTWARSGYAPTEEAIRAAAERGADIADLVSSPFTSELAEWADLILTMTAEQHDEVVERASAAAPRTFALKELVALLRELDPAGPAPSREQLLERIAAADALRRAGATPQVLDVDVADPLGLPEDAYRSTAWEIEGLVDALAEELLGSRARARARGRDEE